MHPTHPTHPDLAETAIAIVGRPNAGKSSLVNRLLREDRMIVSEMPGTTRDSVDSLLQWHSRTFRIVDTAGHSQAGQGVEVADRIDQRAARAARDRARRRGRAGDRCDGRPDRSGRRHRRRGEGRRARRDRRRQQVGPDEGPGRGRVQDVRREPSLSAEVPGLRADPAHFRGHRRAHAQAARGGRQGRGGRAQPGADRRAQSIHREDHDRSRRRSRPASATCA